MHLHYLGWPDRGTPSATKPLRLLIKRHLELRRQFCSQNLQGPSVIHCSAGIGRSGTFVAATFLLQRKAFQDFLNDKEQLRAFVENYEETRRIRHNLHIPNYFVPTPSPTPGWEERLRPLGVAEVVHSLREQRNPRMVQTEKQYRFLYEVLRDEILEYVATHDQALSDQQPESSADSSVMEIDEPSPSLNQLRQSRSSPLPRREETRSFQVRKRRLIEWDSPDSESPSGSFSAPPSPSLGPLGSASRPASPFDSASSTNGERLRCPNKIILNHKRHRLPQGSAGGHDDSLSFYAPPSPQPRKVSRYEDGSETMKSSDS